MADDGSLKSQIEKQKHMIADDVATRTRERVAEELAQSTRDIASHLVISTADIAERLASLEVSIARKLEQQYDALRQHWFSKQLIWNQIIIGLILAVLIVVVCEIFTLP